MTQKNSNMCAVMNMRRGSIIKKMTLGGALGARGHNES